LLTVPEAAKRVGKDPETVRRWIRAGKLRSTKIGTQHMIDEHDLLALEGDDDMAPLPPGWDRTSTGEPMPNWVRIIRRSRAAH
jgi:excisionase family DNA binding protein